MLIYFIYLVNRLLGDDEMMAILFASRVILGKTEFNDVPAKLKQAVYEELLLNGVEFLAGDYVPVPK